MPKSDAQGRMHGFQLWGNLPKALKMTARAIRTCRPKRCRTDEDDGTASAW